MRCFTAVLCIISALCVGQVAARLECTNTTRVAGSLADYLFLIDASGSMCNKIAAVASGLSQFAALVSQSQIQARYAIVQYGGNAKILLPFVSNPESARTVLVGMGCSAGGQEAAFEAIRGSIPPINGADFQKGCAAGIGAGNCVLNWNSTASKVIIMVTDEDSDVPRMPAYMVPGQGRNTSFCADYNFAVDGSCNDTYSFEPSFIPSRLVKITTGRYNRVRSGTNLRLGDDFEAELELTARLLVQQGIFLNSVVSTIAGTSFWYEGQKLPISAFNPYYSTYFNSTDGSVADNVTTGTYQFGHPGYQVQASNFSSFNANATYANLVAYGFGNSVQARMLKAGMYSRVFDIANFDNTTNQAGVVQAFYSSIVESTMYLEQHCQVIVDPETTSSIFSTPAVSASSSANVAATSALSTSTVTATSSLPLEISTALPTVSSAGWLASSSAGPAPSLSVGSTSFLSAPGSSITTSVVIAEVSSTSVGDIGLATTSLATSTIESGAQVSTAASVIVSEATNLASPTATIAVSSALSVELPEASLSSSSVVSDILFTTQSDSGATTKTLDGEASPTMLEIASDEPTTGKSSVGSIIGAVIGAIAALTVVALLLIHRRRAMSGLRQFLPTSESVGAAMLNPLYQGKSEFQENPMYLSKDAIDSTGTSADALA